MKRYFIYMAYNGTHYSGWQKQPNGVGVQEKVENVLATVLRRRTPLTGAGRTDAGVHARMMVAHFDCPDPIPDPDALTGKLNRMLPADVALNRIVPVLPDAHARFSALSREYEYTVTERKDPFSREYECRMSLRGISMEAMNSACQTLAEYTDFTSFSKRHTDVKTFNCRIQRASWREQDGRWIFTIRADRFLRNMVRALAGTLLDVGRNKLSLDGFRRIIEQKDRCAAGNSAPPEGLALTDIEYPDNLFIND